MISMTYLTLEDFETLIKHALWDLTSYELYLSNIRNFGKNLTSFFFGGGANRAACDAFDAFGAFDGVVFFLVPAYT